MIDHLVRRALADALAMVFPVWCAGCDAPGELLCPGCRGALTPDVRCRRVGDLTVYSALGFEGVTARVIRAIKEEGRTSLVGRLAPALAVAVGAAGRGALVVPMPATLAARRRRGYALPTLLCRSAGLAPRALLRTQGARADQRGLDRAERIRNVVGAFRAHPDAQGRDIVLVDDVITTGATLREAALTLRQAGARVVAAATVAATPARRP